MVTGREGNSFEQLFAVTKELYELVEVPPASEVRDEYIERLTSLTEERGLIIRSIKVEPDDGDKVLLEQSVRLNEAMAPRLGAELNRIKRDMFELKKKKESGRRYENPYDYGPLDGSFIDKKN
ncbi:hypothetical protein [Evansella tamaricis]|uniref:Flagellar protein FliT n=1 Tax=Evansella tamaricis TaxID=2069301 RepID=A0ABS6JGH7_9BACI|nr:hypothetical protein [Evansella tamaricis]MBU9712802.1 hypothetical protein [Evansella tamaricis]